MFEQRIYHAVGPNLSEITRKTIFMGYSYRWLRPLDYVVQPPEVLTKVQGDAIRWQLLGAWATEMAFSLPKDEDVPLRAWYQQHGLGNAEAPQMGMDAMAGGARRPERVPSSVGARMDA